MKSAFDAILQKTLEPILKKLNQHDEKLESLNKFCLSLREQIDDVDLQNNQKLRWLQNYHPPTDTTDDEYGNET